MLLGPETHLSQPLEAKMKDSPFKNTSGETGFTYAEEICPSCDSKGLSLFYEVRNIPIHCTSIMLTREEASKSPQGDIVLGFCEQCGFITNIAFDPAIQDNSPIYEEQQGFSPTFQAYADELADHLINKYDLYDKNIVEIGCGKGDFLIHLCELGHNRGVGIDPISVNVRAESEAANRLVFIQDYYSEQHGRYHSDLVVCRHTLEHIPFTAEFVRTLRRAIGDRIETTIFFEVPDVTRILSELAFWDIYYEHCSYFSPGSLARLFRHCGFELTDFNRAYDDQYLLLEATPVRTPSRNLFEIEESPEYMAQNIKSFSTRLRDMLDRWAQRLRKVHNQGKRTVIWGSGSKCVGFMTSLTIKDEIEYVVDINPYRHGKFIPGVGKEIKPPKFLKQYKPDLVIVMNSIYLNEIKQALDNMDVPTEVISV